MSRLKFPNFIIAPSSNFRLFHVFTVVLRGKTPTFQGRKGILLVTHNKVPPRRGTGSEVLEVSTASYKDSLAVRTEPQRCLLYEFCRTHHVYTWSLHKGIS